jgi:hypothetical protein
MSPAPATMPAPGAAVAAAAAMTAAPSRRGGGFRRFVLFLLIFAVTGFAVLMWVDPNARQRTVEWSKATYAKLQDYASKPGGTSGGAGAGAPAATEPSAADDFDVPDPPARPETPAAPAPTAAAAPAVGGDEPAEKPEAETSAPSPDPLAETPRVEAAPAPRPTPTPPAPAPSAQAKRAAKPQAAPEKAGSDGSVPSAEGASERMRALQAAALAAEGRRDTKGRYAPDWAGALNAYEQIRKTVPSDLWPTNLDVKIEIARNQLERAKAAAAKSAPAAPPR